MPAHSPPLALPAVIGHRGAHGHAPENTRASFAKAAELGAGWIEFDVRLSRDGELVTIHDATLERTTDGTGAVAERTWPELSRLDAGAWFGPEFAGERVMTLEQALGALEELGLGANVEIKADRGFESESGAAAARILAERWPAALPPPLVSSFSSLALSAVQEVAPQLLRGHLFVHVPPDWRAILETFGCRSLNAAQDKLEPELVTEAKAAGYAVVAFTVNEPKRARLLWEWGVDAVVSDYPDRLLDM